VQWILELAVVFAALIVGSRVGGMGLGLCGGLGLAVLTFGFGVTPTSPPIDVMLIIVAVVSAASSMEAAGGIDFLVRMAERIIRRNPTKITYVAPLVTFAGTVFCGTSHMVYPLLEVIYEVAHEYKIRPERPLAIATIAAQQGITASPVSAATSVMIALLAPKGIGLFSILSVTLPASLIGIFVAAFFQNRTGRDLDRDPEYLARLEAGLTVAPISADVHQTQPLPRGAKPSVVIFLCAVIAVVVCGAFPTLRPVVLHEGKPGPLAMSSTIEIIMLSAAALILFAAHVKPSVLIQTRTAQAGFTAVVAIFGLAWMGDSFLRAHEGELIAALKPSFQAWPALFAVALFFASALLNSQAATTRALMPLGLTLGIHAPFLIAMFPAVNGYFFFPTCGTMVGAMMFDTTGTTRVSKWVFTHSFMKAGLMTTGLAVIIGLLLIRAF